MEKDVVLDEIKEILNLKERIIARIFKNVFVKIYKKGIEKGFNSVV